MLLLSFETAVAQIPGKAYGGTKNDQGFSVCVLADGNYAMVGRTRSFGAGANDIWVLKLSAAGRVLWSRTLGSELLERAYWVEATRDGGLVVLGFSNGLPGRQPRHDAYLVKMDLDGNILWEGLYGSIGRDIGFCVRESQDSGFVFLGYTKSYGNRGDLFFVKTDSVGNEIWRRHYSSPYVDYGHEFLLTADGGYLLFGSESGFYYPTSLDHAKKHADMFLIKVDADGIEQWRKNIGGPRHELGRALHAAPGGGFYLFGSTQSYGAGSFDQYLVRIDSNYDTLWTRTYGGTEWEYGNSIDLDAEGNLYLLGTTNSFGQAGSPDIWLQKVDPNGNLIWSLTLGGNASDYGYQVKALPEGGCILAGDTRSFGEGEQDVFFTRVTASGQIDILLQDVSTNEIVIYPVPVSGTSVVDPRPLIGQEAFEWRVYNTRGKLVVQDIVAAGNRTSLKRSRLRTGAYIYEVWVKGEVRASGKFLVQ